MFRRSVSQYTIARLVSLCAGLCAVLAVPASVSASPVSASPVSASPVSARVSGGPMPGGSPVLAVSHGCKGRNAEVEQAVDYPYVYVTWIGCGGIGFARSVNGGRSFGPPLQVPESAGHGYVRIDGRFMPKEGWDPAIALTPDGTVYVSYMIFRNGYAHPRMAVSTNHGASFARVSQVMPPAQQHDNWGDRDFIAVAPNGTIYLTWDYGPSLKLPDANIVIQKSSDAGRTWTQITPVSPGYPGHGGDVAGPLVARPGGRLDVLLWVDHDPGLHDPALPPGHDYFTSSANGGRTWSKPIAVAPDAGTDGNEFVSWIDADIGIDAAGTLYATWDTQHPGGDIGWLSYSTDGGRTWSPAHRVTPDHDNAEHIMAVVGGRPGLAYVGWLTGGPYFDRSALPFSQYLRVFSVRCGWLTAPIKVSVRTGNAHVWPGDTIGISLLPGWRVMLTWGSAVGNRISEIWAREVSSGARARQPIA
jgi:hypothetical protein